MTQPRVAVVTPYHLESSDMIERCRVSVAGQSYANHVHIWIADGHARDNMGPEHIILPHAHADAGATPRALGAISAFSRGFDAVAFLDVDNTYVATHLERMIGLMFAEQAHVVTATRNICNTLGDLLFVDVEESNGRDFCDTNCMFIGRSCLHLLTYWVTSPAARLWSDRHFWSAIKQSGAKTTHCGIPTVNYHSKWAWHYHRAGLQPPDDSVWIHNNGGMLVHQLHKDVRKTNNES